jgi:hypothetical protein
VIRHLKVALPARSPSERDSRNGRAAAPTERPIRLLAVSDEIDPSLWDHLDRETLGPLDLLVSSGDLPPDYLSYLEGTLRVPFVFVMGNHDLDEAWAREAGRLLPWRKSGAQLTEAAGVPLALLDWPGGDKIRSRSQDWITWRQVLGLWLAVRLGARRPDIVVSHVAPDQMLDPRDLYHRSFPAYRWLARRLRPALWLHGHTTPASVPERVTRLGPTTSVNVTGAYLIELEPAVTSAGAPSVAPPGGPRPEARIGPPPG